MATRQQRVEAVIRQHIDWVYASARRRVRDEALAEDVTQAVFILFWQKGDKLPDETSLTGWLYRAACYCAANALRLQGIRQKHEREAAMAAAQTEAPWSEINEKLEQAMDRLGEKDRRAVLLRFYRGLNLAEVGAILGVSEEAAKKRVQRALEKLRTALGRKGVVAGAAGLAGRLVEKTTQAVPATFAQAVATAVQGGGTATTAAMAKGTAQMMMWAKLRIAATITLLATGAVVAAEIAHLSLGHGASVASAGVSAAPRKSAASGSTPTSAPSPAPLVQPAPALAGTVPAPTTSASLGRYVPDPARSVFAAGKFSSRNHGRPTGWADLSAFDSSNARLRGNYLELRSEREGAAVHVGAVLPLQKEWKILAVAARLRGHDLKDGSSEEAAARVRMVLLDQGGRETRTVAEFQPLRQGAYRDWASPTDTFAVPENSASLAIIPELVDCTGTLDVLWITVVPIDPAKEIDPLLVRALWQAIEVGNVPSVRQMISDQPRLLECRGVGYDFGTPLSVAARVGQSEVAQALIDMGADMDAGDLDWNMRPIGWAAYFGHPEVLEVLLKAGADPRASASLAQFGMSRRPPEASEAPWRQVLAILDQRSPATGKSSDK